MGTGIVPIRWGLNNSEFELALLFCASGFDIIESKDHFYNGLWWATTNNWRAIMQKYLVQDMNNPKGLLNKQDLRTAYKFYKSVEDGTNMDPSQINQYCLLWLVCVLGDLQPLKALPTFTTNVNKVIPVCHFTPIMMATYCGHKNVVDFLVEHGAMLNCEFTTIDPHPGPISDACYTTKGRDAENSQFKDTPNLIFIAITTDNWQLAQTLIDSGCTPSKDQKHKYNTKLKFIKPLQIQVTTLTKNLDDLNKKYEQDMEELHKMIKMQQEQIIALTELSNKTQ